MKDDDRTGCDIAGDPAKADCCSGRYRYRRPNLAHHIFLARHLFLIAEFLLLAGCADPLPPPSVHDAADHMFLDLLLIARRDTLPTRDDAILLSRQMNEIDNGDDACAKWKLHQILSIGMPLVVRFMTADAGAQSQLRGEARRQLQQASIRPVPDDLCHGHRFPAATFGPGDI